MGGRDIAAIERQVEHRAWPMPTAPWIMFQSWRELLFAHWPIPRERLRPLVPPQLEVDEFDGTAWLAITPFRLTDLHARFIPPIAGFSEFPEMNLRTYVRHGDKPGIYFFSLDAGSGLAVAGARLAYRLPYFRADMRTEWKDGWIEYRSRRRQSAAEFGCRYRPIGEVFEAERGTLEYFLAERYALYAVLTGGRVLRGEIHHGPWPLQQAEAMIDRNTMFEAHALAPDESEPLLHYSARQDTLIWPPVLT
jgi:uncharacterized protein YqjF (DUF2071 family)